MRIGVVTTSYPRWPGDLAGNFVEGHVRAMRALGHEVEVVAAGDLSVREPSVRDSAVRDSSVREPSVRDSSVRDSAVRDSAVRDSSVRDSALRDSSVRDSSVRDSVVRDSAVHRIASPLFYAGGAPDLLERSPRPLESLAFTARLAAAVARRSRRWDAIVAHWLAPSALACLPNRLPLLAIAHGGDVHLLRRLRLLGPVLHALRLRGARLAFASSELRDIARAAAPSAWLDESIVQPMGIDGARFAAIRETRTDLRPPPVVDGARELVDPRTELPRVEPILAAVDPRIEPLRASAGRPHRILVAARLVPVKGVDVAIAALAHVRAQVELVIAGDGPARAELVARAPANVTFLGRVDAIDPLLRDASVVVVPSRVLANGRSEGTPMIALEALAAGVPVVASAVGGLRDLPARLVPPDDPRALADAIDLSASSIDAPSPTFASTLDWRRVAQRLLDHARFPRCAA